MYIYIDIIYIDIFKYMDIWIYIDICIYMDLFIQDLSTACMYTHRDM